MRAVWRHVILADARFQHEARCCSRGGNTIAEDAGRQPGNAIGIAKRVRD